ncbi:pyridoxal 5'-phosphate synthase [Nocardioides sambongensis]|uniref:pyridoxal 5'-phosphate synthase n=1 Tax=Nocardioides sambongensis TaxID=2589074 RepID=UPI002F25EB7F
MPRAEVDAYFASRPRGSQIGAWASAQSQPVPDRDALERAYADAEQRFSGADVPTPPAWGGYLVRPEVFEFWQGRPGRMHDRLRFRRTASGWERDRLAP